MTTNPNPMSDTERKFIGALKVALERGMDPIEAAAAVAAEANDAARAAGWTADERTMMLLWWAGRVAEIFDDVIDLMALDDTDDVVGLVGE